jgi:WD40 repeat protein
MNREGLMMALPIQTPQLSRRWQQHLDDFIIDLAYAHDGTRLVAGSISGPISMLEVASGVQLWNASAHALGTQSLSISPNSKLLASGGQDSKLRWWNASTGMQIHETATNDAWVQKVAWNPKSELLLVAAGKRVVLHNPKGETFTEYPEFPATVADIVWTERGKSFFVASYGGAWLFTLDNSEAKRQFPWQGSILEIALSPDENFLAGGAQDRSVHFWKVKSGNDLEMSGYPQKVEQLAWDQESRFLATGGGEMITIWDCGGKGPAKTTPIQFDKHQSPIQALAFQTNGPLLAAGCSAGLLTLWAPGFSKKMLGEFTFDAGISQIQWSPTGKTIAVGCEDGAVNLMTI